MNVRRSLIFLSLCMWTFAAAGQQPPKEFDVASIKRSAPDASGGFSGQRPDGTVVWTSQPVESILPIVAGQYVAEVRGLPEWTRQEEYDVIAKPPAGAAPADHTEMWRALLSERMKLRWHIEQEERTALNLVLARKDGRLGPQLRPTSASCGNGAQCGGRSSRTGFAFEAVSMERLAQMLQGPAGYQVVNRTGLEGLYSVTLTFLRGSLNSAVGRLPDDPPDLETALQEQLGLKFERGRALASILVIDYVERPSPN